VCRRFLGGAGLWEILRDGYDDRDRVDVRRGGLHDRGAEVKRAVRLQDEQLASAAAVKEPMSRGLRLMSSVGTFAAFLIAPQLG
jgi:hypothetical protein